MKFIYSPKGGGTFTAPREYDVGSKCRGHTIPYGGRPTGVELTREELQYLGLNPGDHRQLVMKLLPISQPTDSAEKGA
ncbi:MAG: hypothetical protein COB66_01350 [Coxiella sp. (in: Bacteria)]|nr:MAG: hypothetical protein COB66_01350 [Coxiella sp. (in: g-proteobacteria)]